MVIGDGCCVDWIPFGSYWRSRSRTRESLTDISGGDFAGSMDDGDFGSGSTNLFLVAFGVWSGSGRTKVVSDFGGASACCFGGFGFGFNTSGFARFGFQCATCDGGTTDCSFDTDRTFVGGFGFVSNLLSF